MVPIIHDASPIRVDIDCIAKDHFYQLKGSNASEKLQSFIDDYSKRSQVVNRALDSMDNLKKLNAPDSLLIMATNHKNATIESFNEFLVSFLSTVDNPTVASFALGRAAQTLPQPTFEKGLSELVKRFPKDGTIKAISDQYESYKAAAQESSRRREQSSWVGKKAPELILPDTNGRSTSISSFKGKFVLVDFWASWCRPCRAENPNVVAAYDRFRNQNFTVLGVSLDKTKDAWINAIHEDGLHWSHISDLAFWNSQAVATYKFDGIPYNILIDPSGTVIAEGLRGEQLPNKLSEVLK
jgi:peroxiredoxin